MSMSKKDFIELADRIKAWNTVEYKVGVNNKFTSDQLEMLVGFCQHQNVNFKADRWLDYIAGRCGPNGGAVKQ